MKSGEQYIERGIDPIEITPRESLKGVCAICSAPAYQYNRERCCTHIGIAVCTVCGALFKGDIKKLFCERCEPKCQICGGTATNSWRNRCKKCIGLCKCIKCNNIFSAKGGQKLCINCKGTCEICGKCVYQKGQKRCKLHSNIKICKKCGSHYKNVSSTSTLCNNCYQKCNICGCVVYHSGHNKCIKHKGIEKCNKCGSLFKGTYRQNLCEGCRPKCKICNKLIPTCNLVYCSNSCKFSDPDNISIINKERGVFLGVDEYEYIINKYRFDMRVGNILIEINPTITHNTHYNPYGAPIDKEYHTTKTLFGRQSGYKCFNIFDRDDPEKIKNYIHTKSNIGSNIKEVSTKIISRVESEDFLNSYNLYGSISKHIKYIGVGVFLYNKLIAVGCFIDHGNNRYTLTRFCYNINTGDDLLLSTILDFFVSKYTPNTINAVGDKSKFSGSSYLNLGFTEIQSHFSCIYYSYKTKDRIILPVNTPDDYHQHLLAIGFLPVPDCGQSTFVRENTKKV